MFRVVFLQILTTVIVSLVAGLLGAPTLRSPRCWAAPPVRSERVVCAETGRGCTAAAGTDPAVFLIGEFVKVVSTLALLGLIVAFYKDLVWLALLGSVIVVLKSYVLTLLVR